ncbi:hypothetical protein [Flammeovirga sp. SJP92]|uniref:hypothetical protein n=1 Tax=Flammeovirga sp. SJP92 TaxID=1775430 RepID=UPI0007885E2C|nr:hypothetical protein [Flammeovirga sp. SJP92]KXX71143.1 hypothetical protein AVL50_09940 [Flammeovirga sp. SJP92]
MKENIWEIKHLEFDIEEFKIKDAKYNIYKGEDGVWEMTICFEESTPIKRDKELEKIIDPVPNFEATALLTADTLELKVGRKIYQKEGYDNEREENLSNVYYFEHSSVEELEIELLDVNETWMKANVKGKTLINGSNGNLPDADFLIQNTIFKLDKTLERSVM